MNRVFPILLFNHCQLSQNRQAALTPSTGMIAAKPASCVGVGNDHLLYLYGDPCRLSGAWGAIISELTLLL
jgi:hypothetical protein